MPIEKMTLGLQVVSTIATIWLGYVGYELTKAQNQIAEVQTYGLPPTVNPRDHFVLASLDDDDQRSVEGTLGVQITNNHTYPITALTLQVHTKLDAELTGCGLYRGIGTTPENQYLCHIDEVIEAGEVRFLEFSIKAEILPPEVWLVLPETKMTAGLAYYDPILDENKVTNGPIFDLDYLIGDGGSFDLVRRMGALHRPLPLDP